MQPEEGKQSRDIAKHDIGYKFEGRNKFKDDTLNALRKTYANQKLSDKIEGPVRCVMMSKITL